MSFSDIGAIIKKVTGLQNNDRNKSKEQDQLFNHLTI
jgi:hypothetical protein